MINQHGVMNQQTLLFTVILLCNKFENWTIDVVFRLKFIKDFVPVTVRNDFISCEKILSSSHKSLL